MVYIGGRNQNLNLSKVGTRTVKNRFRITGFKYNFNCMVGGRVLQTAGGD
jgi:hypothetical protein